MVFLPSNLGFLFLSRCLIFKVQSLSSQSSLLEDSSKSVSHSFSFVNTFLKVFSTFFVSTFLKCFRSLASACIYYHIAQEKSSLFGQFFKVSDYCAECFLHAVKVVWFKGKKAQYVGFNAKKKPPQISPRRHIMV